MCSSGIPNLRIGFGESGVGWIPYALHRMDFEFEDRFRDLMKLKPSEYWRRQCRATFQFDPIGAKLIDDIGLETIMWGSDYPHTDGIWPEFDKIHRRAVRRPDARADPQDHLRERRQVLSAVELALVAIVMAGLAPAMTPRRGQRTVISPVMPVQSWSGQISGKRPARNGTK